MFPPRCRCALQAWLLLSLLTVGECDKVKGYEGGTVTLPCHYDYSYHGALSICWGKGEVPWSKCSDTIIEAKGNKIIFQSAKKYQLLGRVENGNVSLTIFNATMSDSGKYHCRIHISGLFNDEKNTVDLDITKAHETTPSKETDVTFRETTVTEDPTVTKDPTQGIQSDAHTTAAQYSPVAGQPTQNFSVVLVCGLLLTLVLLVMAAFLIRQRRKKTSRGLQTEQNSSISVIYNNTNGSMDLGEGMVTWNSTVENVYHIDPCENANDYEMCP
ncbi:hepatitis A virus cellular receptor 1 isoform X2 [Denticeps clupeoides]|uniref:hepatitis A virus cellular receptor 1 isoform X2 n=1 Tax=Denticeps clupeoides TaxID=299321 RepID=UPI0010A2EEDA|nr:hepatitis A virus cellular receptor 1 homolog isoform X2 [Denticeps clupeoides]